MDQPLFGETTPRSTVVSTTTIIVSFVTLTVDSVLSIQLEDHRLLNIVFGIATGVFFVVTVGLAFFAPVLTPAKCYLLYNHPNYCVDALDLLLCLVILLFLIPPGVIAYWYHKGELTPKFKTLLYFNLVIIVVFCLVACITFYEDGFVFRGTPSCNDTGCYFPYHD